MNDAKQFLTYDGGVYVIFTDFLMFKDLEIHIPDLQIRMITTPLANV